MALTELDNSNINKHLGRTSLYKSQYEPTLLVREERQSNRTHLNLDSNNLPFLGRDTWNAYEVSEKLYIAARVSTLLNQSL
mgnify:CR=1 FL=1